MCRAALRGFSRTIGFAASDVLAVAAYVGALGITIGVAVWPPLFIMSLGGQDKSAGGQFVFALDRADPSLGLPTSVTSLLFVLLLLLSALATAGGASATTTATTPATARCRPLLIACGCPYVLTYVIAARSTSVCLSASASCLCHVQV